MQVRVVGAAAAVAGHPLSTFVIDGVLAVDAGALGWFDAPEVQARVRDVLLTHAHIDHVAGLPGLLENVYRLSTAPPTVHGSDATLAALQNHLFNDVLMPDFIGMSRHLPPFLKVVPIAERQAFPVGPYSVTALDVDHTVPTLAFVIDDGTSAVAFVTDTGPIPLVLADLIPHPRLKAVFLEASFPNSMNQLAAVSKHLTSAQFLEAARHFPPSVPVYAIHMKVRFFDEIRGELLAAGLPNVRIAGTGQVIEV